MTDLINPSTLTAWLTEKAGVPVDRAAAAAAALACSWNEGDHDYQTARDILGDHLSDDDSRPKLIADDLAAHVGLTLKD
ncbi:hypothetical protein L3Q65_00955 (plasmid) [Amycolatopsis sp. FU40]|uniref:hypothetical protein n=1 Tax=Amycolatopsis sp. FU40 TaxID=2914159 RepID=UPI001F18D45F|nr:hypothetical protein [Amycolatopsis sp. FU40]UKD50894.1 hypothetical protein L3Q65_00955 [Amycolatopsis sp. FU40]